MGGDGEPMSKALTAEERDLIDGRPFALVPWSTPLKVRSRYDEAGGGWARYG
jgi:hypothetical protein